MLSRVYRTFKKLVVALVSGIIVPSTVKDEQITILDQIIAKRKHDVQLGNEMLSCHPVSDISDEFDRREALFIDRFVDFSIKDCNGLLMRSRNRVNPDEWNLDPVLDASRVNHDYYLDPRFTEPDGVVFPGDLESLWRNLEDSAVGGLSWNQLRLSKKDIESLFSEIETRAWYEENFKQSVIFLIRSLQEISGLKAVRSRVMKIFAAGGFIARGPQRGEPEIPACVFGCADLILKSTRKGEPEIAATGEFKKRPPLKAGETERFGKTDGLPSQNWVAGIGSGSKRFFSTSTNGFKLFWLTKDTTFEPLEGGPQERMIIETFPAGPDMASFDEYENRKIFLRFLHGLARASGIQPNCSSRQPESDSSSPDDDSSDDADSDQDSGDNDSTEENRGDSNMQKTLKKANHTGSTSTSKTTKFVPQDLKHKRVQSEPTIRTLIKGGTRSADMTVIRVNISCLDRKIREALDRVGREIYLERRRLIEEMDDL